ncbi:hypothetical protein EBR96_09515 [bacterium]|nr:hypothetical protein [bacterium]
MPLGAAVGQKVSATGVVSTYSLVSTGSDFYGSGVLDPFGNIYIIPWRSTIGQTISTNTTRPIGYALSPFFNKF